MTTQTNVSKSIPGTEIKVGDVVYRGWKDDQVVTKVVQGRHELGARFAIVTLESGEMFQAWQEFLYRIYVTPWKEAER